MLGFEKRIIDWFIQKKDILFFIAVSAVGVFIRYEGRDYISADMSSFLIPWFEEIKNSGKIEALGHQVGNYNILYQTIIAFCTYLNVNSVYIYKIISIVFDYILALSVAWNVCQLKGKKLCVEFNLIYAVILFLPTVVLNSAYWGQCDSVYATFVILTLLSLYRKKYIKAFIFLGIAFAFKLQTILILPFIICYYIVKREFSAIMFGLSTLVFWLSGIAGIIFGRSRLDPFRIYMKQADTYHSMWMNVASFWSLLGDNYKCLNSFAKMVTFLLCGTGLYLLLSGKKKMDTLERFLNSVCWFVWTCVLFLPAMHERYTYILDLLLIILCFINKRYVKYAALSVLLSTITYGSYLFEIETVDTWQVLLYVLAWIHFSLSIMRENEEGGNLVEKEI